MLHHDPAPVKQVTPTNTTYDVSSKRGRRPAFVRKPEVNIKHSVNGSEKTELFGLKYHNITRSEAISRLRQHIENRRFQSKSATLFFINVHSFQLAKKDADFRHCINQADLVLPDGSGLSYAAKATGKPIKENLNGTDFIPALCKTLASEGRSVYLLGANTDTVNRCTQYIRKTYPGLKVLGGRSGYFFQDEHESIISEINSLQPDLLLVAMGSPLQEKWVMRNASILDVGICSAVGGLFDFWSGKYRRAPAWMRKAGIEWVYRFMQDPITKWKRVFVEIPVFLFKIGYWSVRRRINPENAGV